MPSIVTLNPSGDLTGVTDATAINDAFSATDPHISVQLGPGDFYVDAPLTPGPGNELAGVKGGINGFTATTPAGTVIHLSASFAGDAVIAPQAGRGTRLRDFAILNDRSTLAGVDGIACVGEVDGLQVNYVSAALVTGHGLAYYTSGGQDGDGLKMRTCMFQRPGLNGVHRPCNDANIHDVHIQYAGQAGDPNWNHGFFTDSGSGGNMTYIGCRSDLNEGCGWVIDHKGTYGDATKLIGCSTERNTQDGVLIDNSSATGSDWRAPVILSGCCFEGDGTGLTNIGGDYAGIRIVGRNRVHISGTITAVSTTDVATGAPRYALYLQQAGSANAQAEIVEWASGRLNHSTGQAGGEAIHNHSLADRLIFGPSVTITPGFESGTDYTRSGKLTLSAGSGTVTSPWVWTSSQIVVSTLVPVNRGNVWVDSRANGSFVVKSSSATDTSTVAWLLTQI